MTSGKGPPPASSSDPETEDSGRCSVKRQSSSVDAFNGPRYPTASSKNTFNVVLPNRGRTSGTTEIGWGSSYTFTWNGTVHWNCGVHRLPLTT